MNIDLFRKHILRREFLSSSGVGLGAIALGSLLGNETQAATSSPSNPGLAGLPHIAPCAKRVIYLMQSGAPSHVDLFDYKPLLAERRGEEIPESIHQGQKLSTTT